MISDVDGPAMGQPKDDVELDPYGSHDPARESVSHASSQCELCKIAANRLYFSKTYSVFYAVMVIINIAAIVFLVSVHLSGHVDDLSGVLIAIEVSPGFFFLLLLLFQYKLSGPSKISWLISTFLSFSSRLAAPIDNCEFIPRI